jgi:predicted TIM-barrel fold metal-dependent hydrolase
MDELIFVSGDGHAEMPPELWPEYLERRHHELLPTAHADNEAFVALQRAYFDFSSETVELIDNDGTYAAGGFLGVWDLDRRLAELDREGVAAELVLPGDPRAIGLFNPLYRTYPQDVVAAGRRAFHRWVTDTFGAATDRLLLVGDAASGTGIDEMLAELEWIAQRGFVGTYLPGQQVRPELPPLYDAYFDPFWSRCEDLGVAVVIHAGYGFEQAEYMNTLDVLRRAMQSSGRDDLMSEVMNVAEDFLHMDLRPRRAMWQMMLGGVFDRHPRLKLLLIELRADWLPATLRHLDAAYERERADLPAELTPSDYWRSNCHTTPSFMHRAEVAMRHEIGVETVTFGRDYPHNEGTWPNTHDWLADAFVGVPDDEVRLMLGENLIRVLGLDRARLASLAARIGPTIDQITGHRPEVDPRLVAHFHHRGGYLKPAEEIRTDEIDPLLREDLRLASTG